MLVLQPPPGTAPVSDSGSVILRVAETRWLSSRGVSSSGTVGIVVAMKFAQLGGVTRMTRERGGRKDMGKRGGPVFDNSKQASRLELRGMEVLILCI